MNIAPANLVESITFVTAVLEAIDEQVAILDNVGNVIAANSAWMQFSEACGNVEATGVGANYLCTLRTGGPKMAEAYTGIRAVLDGTSSKFVHEQQCPLVNHTCWVRQSVKPLNLPRMGAVVTQQDVTSRRISEQDSRIAAIAFESSEGQMVADADGLIMRVNAAFTAITGYKQDEVMGKSPALLSSGRHDGEFYRSMWSAIVHEGVWNGEIWNRRKNGEVYAERLRIAAVRSIEGPVTHYVASLSDLTNSNAANTEIQSLAFYDTLTNLPNRRLLMDRLQHALATVERNSVYGALLYLDLDNFKLLNECLGHSVGDYLLQQVALRLKGCIREADTVARVGGDEFVVLLDGLSNVASEAAAQVSAVSTQILLSLGKVHRLSDQDYHCISSIGATMFNNAHHSPEELLTQGDISMYQSKRAGGGCLRFFDQKMQDRITVRVAMERNLRDAISKKHFELYYQVQVNGSGRPTGVEGLIRWRKSDGTLVSPAAFIPLAEECGLIVDIGDWVIDQACKQLRRWESDAAMAELVLAINVSACQFQMADFEIKLRTALERHGARAERLKLELTEGVLLEHCDEIIASMHSLKRIGVQFSLDDFGTGYSSLQYLKKLPLNQLKIDQSFVSGIVSNLSDRAIVRTIVAMARSLDLEVIAEGVEKPIQRDLLKEAGCFNFQGYLYSCPVALDAFEQLVHSCQ